MTTDNLQKDEHKYCRKCLRPLTNDCTSDGFCDAECRKEFYREERKLAEEVLEN